MPAVPPTLIAELFASARVEGEWLDRALLAAESGTGSIAFRAAYAGSARRLGARAHEPFTPPKELAGYTRPHWTVVDIVRAHLLARALSFAVEEGQPALVLALFDGGEIGEQESVLRTLSILPSAERLASTALSACRTNATRVFAALACENPFPARHLAEPGFNQMVLKAIFTELSVRRIEGLAARVTPELVRMVESYASERRAAGRPVPEDVAYVSRGARA
jgi:hypothetical protein